MSYPTFRDWRARNTVFEDLAGLPSTNQSWTLRGRGEPVALVGRLVSWNFFSVLGVPPRLGRAFVPEDEWRGVARVVVVSETLARRQWPGGDAVGKRLKIPLPPTEYHDTWLTVVGVVGDARYRELRATRLDLYMPYRQSDHRPHHLVVRARGDVAGLPAALQRLVRELDPEQPAPDVVAMTDVVSAALGGPRFAARVASALALVALLLAALGLYGLVAYSVGRRTRELGIRVALGARPADVARLVLGEGLLLAVLGVALGLAGATTAARLISSLLFGVGPADTLTLAAASTLLLAVAGVASAVPVRRALRVEPAAALREE